MDGYGNYYSKGYNSTQRETYFHFLMTDTQILDFNMCVCGGGVV